jgi:hypothetical protein
MEPRAESRRGQPRLRIHGDRQQHSQGPRDGRPALPAHPRRPPPMGPNRRRHGPSQPLRRKSPFRILTKLNICSQPEPVTGPTRPSSAMFGYPNLSGTMQRGSMHGTLPPVPLPRLNLQAQMASRAASVHGMRPLDNSSSSEEEDKADLLGRNFQVPRPKSRSNASIAVSGRKRLFMFANVFLQNQSGIYYDVDYDQHEAYKQSAGIPMSTYSMGRPPYYRN